MWHKLVGLLGDVLFALRDRWDKLRARRAAAAAGEAPQPRIDWRAAIRENRSLLIGVGAVLAAVAWIVGLYLLVRPAPAVRRTADSAYYLDLATGKLFVSGIKAVPPIDAPSGKATPDGTSGGVRAHVFACGSCDSKGARYVAYVETYAPEAKAVLSGKAPPEAAARPMEPPQPDGAAPPTPQLPADLSPMGRRQAAEASGLRVAKAIEPWDAAALQWFPASFAEAREVRGQAGSRCRGQATARECVP